jgi:glutathione-regulated potassium-efflux system ancillary protein KefF
MTGCKPIAMILLLHAHPYPKHSRACRALLDAVRDLPDVEVRSLYDLYPDFDIDVAAEQAALIRAELIVWLHPIYWYSVPSLLKHWFDTVLVRGWAYGQGGNALRGKRCLWVSTTGGDDAAYSPAGIHEQPFERFAAPIEQTARFCGMQWQVPVVVHGAHTVTDIQMQLMAQDFRARLLGLHRNLPENDTLPKVPVA